MLYSRFARAPARLFARPLDHRVFAGGPRARKTVPMTFLSLVVALSFAAQTGAAPLASTAALLDDKRPTEALASLEGAVSSGGLSAEQLVRAYELMGRAHGLLGRGQQAQRAFASALRIEPGWRLEDLTNPEVKGPYDAALSALPPPGEALLAALTREERDGRRGMLARLVADDMDLVAGARVLLDGAALTTLPLARGEPEVFYPLDPAAVRGRLEVQLIDAYGNELGRLPLEIVVDASGAAAGREPELRWLALGGGTLLGLGTVGVTAAGIWFAAVDGGDLEAPEGARTVGLAGVGLATGIIALGGALVVLDFLLEPAE